MKSRLNKTIKRLEKMKVIDQSTKVKNNQRLNAYEIKVFRQLREKYDLSVERNIVADETNAEKQLSDEAKQTLERI
ncbi:MAG: hypothetical protein CMP32_00220, partial [Rickettsiales bacterium]|nr:hypothetical protein [Rickettsiales bacterium]